MYIDEHDINFYKISTFHFNEFMLYVNYNPEEYDFSVLLYLTVNH